MLEGMKSLGLSLLVMLFFSSCLLPSEPDSKVQLDRSWGLAGAMNLEDAEKLAATVEDVLGHYRNLGGFEDNNLRIHVSEELGELQIDGITRVPTFGDAWVAVRQEPESFDNTVAHELVHFCFPTVLARFPQVFQEGLAEHMAGELYPAQERRKNLLLLVAASYLDRFTIELRGASARQQLAMLVDSVPSVEELFEYDWSDSLGAERRVTETFYGLGILVGERVGWEGMLELVARADREGREAVPAKWILGAAGLEPPTQEKLRAAVLEALGIDDTNGEGQLRIILTG